MSSSALAIALFLNRVKALIKEGKLLFQPRNPRKTWEFMHREGLAEEDVTAIIACLEAKHYYEGPSADDDGSAGNVMVFLYPFKKAKLYIKLKIWTDAGADAGVVMSFHEEGMYD